MSERVLGLSRAKTRKHDLDQQAQETALEGLGYGVGGSFNHNLLKPYRFSAPTATTIMVSACVETRPFLLHPPLPRSW